MPTSHQDVETGLAIPFNEQPLRGAWYMLRNVAFPLVHGTAPKRVSCM